MTPHKKNIEISFHFCGGHPGPIVDLIGFWPIPTRFGPLVPPHAGENTADGHEVHLAGVVVFDHPGGWQNAVQNSRQRR